MRRIMIAWLFLACGFLPAVSQQSLYLVSELWPPYGYEEDGALKGLDIDLLQAAARKAGIGLTIEFFPWSRAMSMVTSGEADGIFSLYKTPERLQYLEFSSLPLSQETLVLVYPLSHPPAKPIRSLADLKGLTVGVLQDNTHGAAFDTASHFTREPSLTTLQSLRKLLLGRMDLQVLNEVIFRRMVKDNPEFAGKFGVADFIVNQEPLFLGVSRQATAKKALSWKKLDEALSQLHREGLPQKSAQHYLGPALPRP